MAQFKKNVFLGRITDGRINFGSDYNQQRLKAFIKENDGMRIKLEPLYPESDQQRKFYHGAVVPLIAFYQEGMNYKNPEDLERVHEWLKLEFAGEIVELGGRAVKIGGSTKGKLNQGFLERVTDWMDENGYQVELLNPTEYKKWRDEVLPYGGPEDYIDYLLETHQLHRIV